MRKLTAKVKSSQQRYHRVFSRWCFSFNLQELAAAPAGKNLASCVMSRRAHNPAARMRPRSTHVKRVNRRSIFRPTRNRAHEEQLIERHVAVKYVASSE